MRTICRQEGCKRPNVSYGLCNTHAKWSQEKLAANPPIAPRTGFWDKVKGGDVSECWEWQAGKSIGGYGVAHIRRIKTYAHRYAYEMLRAEIPDGLHLDHLCRNRACVNPWHLEPVTAKVNASRTPKAMKTHCIRGHAFNESNTKIRKNGTRGCKKCNVIRAQQYSSSRAKVAA